VTRCGCGNTARYGHDTCGRCGDRDAALALEQDLFDDVEAAARDIHDPSLGRFANAVVEYLRELRR
jgi:hypothetical protein